MGLFSKIFNKSSKDTQKSMQNSDNRAEPVKLSASKFNLNNTLRDVANVLAPMALEKKISIIYRVNKDVPSIIIGDRYKLTTLLSELIGNAIDFSDKKESITVNIRRNADNVDALELHFSITDRGVGISEQALNDVITPMLRSDLKASEFGIEGSGLVRAREIVHAMFGSITMSCDLDRGCIVSFYVLLSTPDIKERRHYRLPSKDGIALQSLIIDEDHGTANALESMLEYFQHSVTQAHDVDIDSFEDFDLLFVCAYMLDESMKERLSALRASQSGVKIVIIEEMMNDSSDAQEILELSDWLLYKPTTQQFVFEMLSALYPSKPTSEEIKGVEGEESVSKDVEQFLGSDNSVAIFDQEMGLRLYENNYTKLADTLKDIIWKYVKVDKKILSLASHEEYLKLSELCDELHKRLEPVGAIRLAQLALMIKSASERFKVADVESLSSIFSPILAQTITAFDSFMEENKYKIDDAT